MPDSVRLVAPAKINLHLGIHPGRDERGYHRAHSLMVALDLVDNITIEPASELTLMCSPDVGVSNEHNLAWKAARALGERFGVEPTCAIDLKKNIPAEAGLGGGSSDAAAVLRGLCTLWGVDVLDERVRDTAHNLGADVAFFLDPRPTLFGGIGDESVRTIQVPDMSFALVRPKGPGVSTAQAYAEFDENPIEARSPEALCDELNAGNLMSASKLLFNNLEAAAVRLVPAVGELLSWLRARPEVLSAQVCGSGSACFALCASDEDASKLAKDAACEMDCWSCATKALSSSLC